MSTPAPPAAAKKYDISDHTWQAIEPLLPGQAGVWGRIAEDNRLFIDAVFWILRTKSAWRNLPAKYGGWKNTHRRFIRWREKRIWETVLEQVLDDEAYAWLLTDAAALKGPPRAAAGKGGRQAAEKPGHSKSSAQHIHSGTWPWLRLVCESESLARQISVQITARLTGAAQ